ncbi:hypothetical protein BEI59_15095 [Eisenbergiella tayi]|uniref:Uncharacterized protein n=1 Tax=Eisenbergiella tayi TaxID=1432052 RepID=A0A1E3UH26_9FIRM|nr:hypothetical protein BEI64_30095 [Eisenbergiella tayi]ODR50691.1 hypothetical protein BEI59_15095 [Eisenbergiella tayi]ODR61871.1 hypothetical protein BEI63_00600 [Eisenbergiella tayi]RJW42339.1 hypothetical protein DXC97_04670 [Lachnospiraceae bacterium TF09-5]
MNPEMEDFCKRACLLGRNLHRLRRILAYYSQSPLPNLPQHPPLFLLLYIKNDRLFMEAVIFISGSGWPARQGSLPELFAALSVGTAGYYGSIY